MLIPIRERVYIVRDIGTGQFLSAGAGTAFAASFVADYGVAVLVLFTPNPYFLFLGTLDASLSHLLVVLDLGFRELTVLPENDVEAKAEDAKSDEDY